LGSMVFCESTRSQRDPIGDVSNGTLISCVHSARYLYS
jgi:hypothetical protein